MKQLGGNWRRLARDSIQKSFRPDVLGLRYTDAPEITGLARLPLGLTLGPVYQLINVSMLGLQLSSECTSGLEILRTTPSSRTASTWCLRPASMSNVMPEVQGDLAVVGRFAPAPIGSLNAAGTKNVEGNRGLECRSIAILAVRCCKALRGAVLSGRVGDAFVPRYRRGLPAACAAGSHAFRGVSVARFSVRELLGMPTGSGRHSRCPCRVTGQLFQKVATPSRDAEAPQPAVEA